MDDRKMSYDSVGLHDDDFVRRNNNNNNNSTNNMNNSNTPQFLSPVKDDNGNFPDVLRLDRESEVRHVSKKASVLGKPDRHSSGGSGGGGTLSISGSHAEDSMRGREEISERRGCCAATGHFINNLMPHGGAMSNVVTLAAVALGSGIMALPMAFQQMGIVLGIIVNTLVTLGTIYSVYALMRAVEKTNKQLKSFENFARVVLGPGWDYLAAFNMFVFGWCSCVFFVIAIGSLLLTATDDERVSPFLRSENGNRVLTFVVWFALMLPVSIPKEINSIRYGSLIACIAMIYFGIVMVVHFVQHGLDAQHHMKHQKEIKMFRSGIPPMVGFSMVVFSYLVHIDTFALYTEMADPTPALMTRDTTTAMIITLFIYFVVGIFGYLEFGNDIPSYILLTYDIRSSPMIAIAYAGMGLAMCFIYALVFIPARDSVYYCIGRVVPCFRSIKTVPFWLHCLICVPLSGLACVAGLFIDKDNVWFSLIASFCTGFLGFIFPALFWMYAGDWTLKSVGWFHYISTHLLLICGVATISFGCGAVLYLEVVGSSE